MYNKSKHFDGALLLLTGACCAIGLLLAASMEYIGENRSFTSGSVGGLFLRQTAAVSAGACACGMLSFVSARGFCRSAAAVMLFGTALTALTFTPLGVSPEGSDDRAWIALGAFGIQPSEILKLCFIISFAAHLCVRRDRINTPSGLGLLLLHAAVPTGMVWLQGDQGTAVVFMVITAGMLMTGGLKVKYIIGVMLASPAAAWVMWRFVLQEHQKQRLAVLLDPSLDPLGAGFQQTQSRLAIAEGGLLGSGLFSREGELVYVSQSQNDFVFSYAGQVGGAVLCAAVIVLEFALVLRLLSLSAKRSGAGRLIASGTAAMLFAHSFINIAMALGFMPVIGVPLPFISAGGTAAVSMLAAVGAVQGSLFRGTDKDNVHNLITEE